MIIGLKSVISTTFVLTLCGLGGILYCPFDAQGQEKTDTEVAKTGPSGLQIPRYVSLKADKVNVRQGPSKDHRVIWIYRRAGLPVEVTAESEHWRRVRDAEGVDGWVYFGLLSGRRTALVLPWVAKEAAEGAKKDTSVALYNQRSENGNVAAMMEAGVLANIMRCDGTWCKVSVNDFSGWIEQEKLWGVYPNEIIK